MHFRGRLSCVEFNMQRIENSFSTVYITERLVYDSRPFVYITVTSPAHQSQCSNSIYAMNV